jgi:hypothetical protein
MNFRVIYSVKTSQFHPKPGVNLALNKKPLTDFSCKWLIFKRDSVMIEFMNF